MENFSRRKIISLFVLGSFLLVKKDSRIKTAPYKFTAFQIDAGDIVFIEGVRFISSIIKNYQKDFRYTHVGIAINIDGNILIIDSDFDDDANYDGVNTKPIEIFVGESSNVLIMRNAKISSKVKKDISKNAIRFIGLSFDFQFILENKKMYCTELVYNIINKSVDIDSDIGLQEILTPQLFHQFISKAGWSPVFASSA